jgi:Domain of unkown function (DUF1775)
VSCHSNATPPLGLRPAGHRRRFGIGGLVSVVMLALAGGAGAHADLTPASLETGGSTRIVARIPNEREGQETTRLTLTFPAGFTIGGAEPSGDWTPQVDGNSVTWTGGRISGAAVVAFALTVKPSLPPGTQEIRLEQGYDDGGTVPTTTPLTVLPALGENAPDQHVGRAIVAGVIGLLVVVVSLLALHMVRRRSAAGRA